MEIDMTGALSKGHSKHPSDWQVKELCIVCLVEVLADVEPVLFKKRALLGCFLKKVDQEREYALHNNGFPMYPYTPVIAKLHEEPELPLGIVILMIDCVAKFGPELAPLANEAILSVLSAAVVDAIELELVQSTLRIIISKILESNPKRPIELLALMRKVLEKYTNFKSFVFQTEQLVHLTLSFISSTDASLCNAAVACFTVLFQEENPVLGLCAPEMVRSMATELGQLLRATEFEISRTSALELIILLCSRKEALDVFLHTNENVNLMQGFRSILMCRKSELQVAALKMLLALMKDAEPDRFRVILNGDITEHLFELICSSNLLLIELAIECLCQLSSQDAFFHRPYSRFGAEPLLRTLKSLLDRRVAVALILQATQLLDVVLVKNVEYGMGRGVFLLGLGVARELVDSICSELRVVGNALLQTLLCKEYICKPIPTASILEFLDILIANCSIVRNSYGHSQILEDHHKENLQYMTSVFRVISACLKLMHSCKEEAICWLSSYSSSWSSSQSCGSQIRITPSHFRERFGKEEETQILDKLSGFLTLTLWPFLVDHAEMMTCPVWWCSMVDCFDRITAYDADFKLRSTFLISLVQNASLVNTCLKLRKLLAGQLTGSQDIKAVLDSFIVLFMTTFLHTESVQYDSRYLLEAMAHVPLDVSQWNAFLYDSSASFLAKSCVLVLRYFMELPCSTAIAEVDMGFLQSLCKILPMLTEETPAYVYKVLWFLTARHCPAVNDTTALLLQALRAQMAHDHNVLAAYYTHDTCLLNFAFATSESADLLGPEVLALWFSMAKDDKDEAVFSDLLAEAPERVLPAFIVLVLHDTRDEGHRCVPYVQQFVNSLAQHNERLHKDVTAQIEEVLGTMLLNVFRQITALPDKRFLERITSSLNLLITLTETKVSFSGVPLYSSTATHEMEEHHIKLFTTFLTFLPKMSAWLLNEAQEGDCSLTLEDSDPFYKAALDYLLHQITPRSGAVNLQMIQLIAKDEGFVAFINRLLLRDDLTCIPWVVKLITSVLHWRRHHPESTILTRISVPEALMISHLNPVHPTIWHQAALDFIGIFLQVDGRLDVLDWEGVSKPAEHVCFLKRLLFKLQDLVQPDLTELLWSCYGNWCDHVQRRIELYPEEAVELCRLFRHPSHTWVFTLLPVQGYEGCAMATRVKQSVTPLC